MLVWMQTAMDQTIHFSPISGPIVNPLMGWAPRASLHDISQPHTLVYADLTWRDFEPQPGAFDFGDFERTQQFDRWRAENQRVVFRFLCDVPGPNAHRDIPDWLYEATGGSGDTYDTSYGKGFSPDYANPLFIQYHRDAILALGKHYAAEGIIAYIELGTLGHWGEWHVSYESGIRDLPPKAVRDQYVQHYREAFPNTPLLMRRPFSIARQFHLGLYNDLTGDPEGTHEWLDWIANGGDYDQTGEIDELVSMPHAWQTAPIGGEQTGARSTDQLYTDDLAQTIQLLEQSHTTFVGPGSPASVDPGGPLQAGIDRVLSRIGYRLYIQQVKMPRWVSPLHTLDLQIIFANDGMAPIYYNWPAQLYLIDRHGEIRAFHQASIDLRKILPGKAYPVALSISLDGLQKGSYNLGFAILDPLTQQPAVRLAMDNPRGDLIQVLGTVEILWNTK
jgi:hypothetical protein